LLDFETQIAFGQLELLKRSREAGDRAALQFIAVNDSHLLMPYRQAALWHRDAGVLALSGVSQVERNGPYVQWQQAVCQTLAGSHTDMPPSGTSAYCVQAADLPTALADDWHDWLPAQGLWVPLDSGQMGLLFARDDLWSNAEAAAMADWLANWHSACLALAQQLTQRQRWTHRLKRLPFIGAALAVGVAAMVLVPVRLSVLAPAELVPAHPVAIRAPLDGVVQQLLISPNEAVRAGQPLFAYDDATLASRREVAFQALATSETELRQLDQQSLYDNKARAALPGARGNVVEKRSELTLIEKQFKRSQVLATSDGIALFDDASEWAGRPVTTGERVMRLAASDDKEIEAWLAIGDAIPLPAGARVQLYLSASPTESLSGKLRYVSHEAQRRPDGSSAYRLRATLDEGTQQRIGVKGTARMTGDEVSLGYWIFRRPLGALREWLGL
jgi:multidrug resistance efflux pump